VEEENYLTGRRRATVLERDEASRKDLELFKGEDDRNKCVTLIAYTNDERIEVKERNDEDH